MSRCFRFPPPGYEERLRPEENLQKEEKHWDKKLKKEKEDKEKREGKDKRKSEKGKNKKEKHRDKKEKHKGKKDKKDKENKRNDNEKSSISEDASIVRDLETRSTEVHMGEMCSVDKGSGINKTKFATLCKRQDEQESVDHSLDRETAESQFFPELESMITDEGRATASTLGRSSATYIRGNEKISSGAYIRGNQEMHKSALTNLQRLAEVKGRNGDRRVDQRQEKGQALPDRAQFSGTMMVRGLVRSVDSKVEGMLGSVHNNSDRIFQQTAKFKADGDHRGEQIKCKDKKEKNNNGKDKGRENEKKLKERNDHKLRDQEKSKILYKIGSPRFNNSNSHLLAVDNKVVSTEEHVKKRKNVEAKGPVPENDLRHNKLPKVTLYLPKDTVQIACQSIDLLDSDRKGIPLLDKEDVKNCKVSDTVDAPSSFMSTQVSLSAVTTSCQLVKDSIKASPADKVVKSSSELPQASLVVEASVKHSLVDKVITMSRSSQGCQVVEGSKKYHHVHEIAESSRKSPHPDMKYLSQVLLVPEPERKEWPEVDNEDWLFSGKHPLFQKPKHEVNESRDYGQPQVWSETMHIESADIYALPYVIPY